ncbi:MAG: hypothetical protein R3Y11_12600 [Pseudomonadota bacterium]
MADLDGAVESMLTAITAFQEGTALLSQAYENLANHSHDWPVASTDTLGGVKASASLEVGSDGTATVPVMGVATASAAGTSGLVPVPPSGGQDKILTGGGWQNQTVVEGVPTGVIVMWSGSTDTIPDGWALCDGTNDTPDLRDRFIMGAGSTYAVGATGGSTTTGSTTLTTSTTPSHTHYLAANVSTSSGENLTASLQVPYKFNNASNDLSYALRGTSTSATLGKSSSIGSSGSHSHTQNLPSYYALAYIMKL